MHIVGSILFYGTGTFENEQGYRVGLKSGSFMPVVPGDRRLEHREGKEYS